MPYLGEYIQQNNYVLFLASLSQHNLVNLLLLMHNLKALMIFHKLGQQMHALSNIFTFVL